MFLLFDDAIIDFFILLSKMCMLTGNLEGGSKIYNKKTVKAINWELVLLQYKYIQRSAKSTWGHPALHDKWVLLKQKRQEKVKVSTRTKGLSCYLVQ